MSDARAIFITGAGAGIGAETALLFVRNGWRVGALDLNAAALDALTRQLGAQLCSAYVADVRDFAAVEAAIGAFTAGGGGRLDALFANAGVLFMGPDADPVFGGIPDRACGCEGYQQNPLEGERTVERV